jgi:RimJ/RimL family protein N-acetyltransferase
MLNQEIILENTRVLLRPLKPSDIDEIEKISYTEGLREYGSYVKSRTDLEGYFDFCNVEKESNRLYPFLIFDKKYNCVAGVTMFGNIDFKYKRLEIGWTWIGFKFQSTGLNRECKELLLDYAFNDLGFRRVEFKIDIKNSRSQRAIEKLGAVKEGLLRNYDMQSYGESEGTFVYSIIKEEWRS